MNYDIVKLTVAKYVRGLYIHEWVSTLNAVCLTLCARLLSFYFYRQMLAVSEDLKYNKGPLVIKTTSAQ